MTLEDLWQLFPIILKDYSPEYKNWYEIEKKELIHNFNDAIVRINHIGSTSVEGLIAKPTVDILMEIKNDSNIDKVKEKLLSM